MTKAERIERLNRNGYKTIHLFRDFYLVRKYSIRYKKSSSYDLRRISEVE